MNKCPYVFKQGEKKDKKCNAPCKGEFCKFNKKATVERKKEYYKEKLEEKKEENVIYNKFKEQLKTFSKLPKKEYLDKLEKLENKFVYKAYKVCSIKLDAIRKYIGILILL